MKVIFGVCWWVVVFLGVLIRFMCRVLVMWICLKCVSCCGLLLIFLCSLVLW